MADVSLKTIKNTLGVAQSVVYKGRQFVLPANDEQTFETEIAQAFLEKCAPIVVEVQTELGKVFAPELQDKTTWIANVTGNPDAPKTVKERRYDKTVMRFTEVEIPNPNINPRPVAREMKGGHRQYTGRDGGLMQESLPSKLWVVPSFRRVPMPSDVAEWFINRDAMTGAGRGAVIASRAKSNFEPDMTWTLEDMRNYARLLDPNMDIGPDDVGVGRQVKAEIDKLAFEHKWVPRKIEVEIRERTKEGLRAAKNTLYQRLYYRLVNPDYRLPTREEYNEFVTGRSQTDVEEAELESILKKATTEINKAEKQVKAQEAQA